MQLDFVNKSALVDLDNAGAVDALDRFLREWITGIGLMRGARASPIPALQCTISNDVNNIFTIEHSDSDIILQIRCELTGLDV